VKWIIYIIVGAALAMVALRYFNSLKPPRE
jgi:hypothetical protein